MSQSVATPITTPSLNAPAGGTVSFNVNNTVEVYIPMKVREMIEPAKKDKFKSEIVAALKPGKKVLICQGNIREDIEYNNFGEWTKTHNISQEHNMIKQVETRNFMSQCPFALGFQVGHEKNAQITDLNSDKAYTFYLGPQGSSLAPHVVYKTDENNVRGNFFAKYGDQTPEKLYDNLWTGPRTITPAAGLVHTTPEDDIVNVKGTHPLIPVLIRTAQKPGKEALYDELQNWYVGSTVSFLMPKARFIASVEEMIKTVLVHFKTDKINTQNLTISRLPERGALLVENDKFTVPSSTTQSPAFNDVTVGFANPMGLDDSNLVRDNMRWSVDGQVDITMDMLMQKKVDVPKSELDTFPKFVAKLQELYGAPDKLDGETH